jgi:hypothetical protein
MNITGTVVLRVPSMEVFPSVLRPLLRFISGSGPVMSPGRPAHEDRSGPYTCQAQEKCAAPNWNYWSSL